MNILNLSISTACLFVVATAVGCSSTPEGDERSRAVESADSRISRESFVNFCGWKHGQYQPHYSHCRKLSTMFGPHVDTECAYKPDGTPNETLFRITNPDNCAEPITWRSGGKLWNSEIHCYIDDSGQETSISIDAHAYPGQAVFEIEAVLQANDTTDVHGYVDLAGTTATKGDIVVALQYQGDDLAWHDVSTATVKPFAARGFVGVRGQIEAVRNVKLQVRAGDGVTPGIPFEMYDARLYGPECVYDETSGGCYK